MGEVQHKNVHQLGSFAAGMAPSTSLGHDKSLSKTIQTEQNNETLLISLDFLEGHGTEDASKYFTSWPIDSATGYNSYDDTFTAQRPWAERSAAQSPTNLSAHPPDPSRIIQARQ